MNWSSVIYGAVVILATVYFLIYARRVYDGPVVLVAQER